MSTCLGSRNLPYRVSVSEPTSISILFTSLGTYHIEFLSLNLPALGYCLPVSEPTTSSLCLWTCQHQYIKKICILSTCLGSWNLPYRVSVSEPTSISILFTSLGTYHIEFLSLNLPALGYCLPVSKPTSIRILSTCL